MVYCDLLKTYEDKAIYSIGRDIDDMTGKIVYYSDDRKVELLKQAEGEPLMPKHIFRIYNKYKNDFQEGIFKEKLSVEIG